MARQTKPRYANPTNQAAAFAQDLDGLIVSVDVSTGDNDYDARVFGRIIGAQPDGASSVTLLAEEVEDTRHPDPLRELAEWLAEQRSMLPAPEKATVRDLILAAAINRAREALGRED